jgi:heme/copper-type cytochrome/quinol oxidase subunit 2
MSEVNCAMGYIGHFVNPGNENLPAANLSSTTSNATTSSTSDNSDDSSNKSTNIGVIIGIVIFLLLIIVVIYIIWRYRRKHNIKTIGTVVAAAAAIKYKYF